MAQALLVCRARKAAGASARRSGQPSGWTTPWPRACASGSITPVAPGVSFLWRRRRTQTACTQNVTCQEVGRQEATAAGKGLAGRKCVCWASSAMLAAACLHAECVQQEGKESACLFPSLLRRCQACLGQAMFYFSQNLLEGHKSNSYLVGSLWEEEIQNVLIHLLSH